MNSYFNFSKKSVLLLAAVMILGSCNDTWNEHYSFKETSSKYPVSKIAETLDGISGFDQFYEALRTTKMCDKHGVPLNITYLDLLSEDQFLTVWAPSNSSVQDWSLYTKKNKSAAEHKEVGEKFIMNHIARFKHSVGEGTDEMIYMLNGKAYKSTNDGLDGRAYHSADERNIRCSNGVLHCIDGHLEYLPNLYEFITTSADYKDIFGDWFKSYTIKELDPSRSVAQGFNDDGEMVYVDSVMTEYNILLNRYARINAEDSTFAMVLPTPRVWDSVYNHIKESFEYAEAGLNNDSLQKFYTNTTMMTDMFYNLNKKVNRYLPDSVFSTKYNSTENRRDNKPYHIFSKPYDPNTGLFSSSVDSIECSNGMVYIIDSWPFADTLTYLRRIRLEAESYTNLSEMSLKQTSIQIDDNDPVQVMRISQEGRKDWEAKIYIHDNLKGRYSVKMVMAPDVVNMMPNYIHPKVSYYMPNRKEVDLVDSVTIVRVEYRPGKFRNLTVKYYAINSLTKMDTIEIGEIDVPYCNYDMNQARLSVTLSSGVNEMNSEKYSSELWLDCIILDPIVE